MNQKIINFDTYIYNYFLKWFDLVYPKNNNFFEKTIIVIFHIIHIFVISFNLFGAFLPPKYLIIYIIFTLLLVSTWYIYGRCPILYATYNIDNRNYDFLPLQNSTRFITLIFLFTFAIIGYIHPNYSLFRIIRNFINYIGNKYD
jgi:hypothetical protein